MDKFLKSKEKLSLINDIAQKVMSTKKIAVEILAVSYGYSSHYFRYYIVPRVLAFYDDIKLVKENGVYYLIYDGDDRKLAEQEINRLQAARPLEA